MLVSEVLGDVDSVHLLVNLWREKATYCQGPGRLVEYRASAGVSQRLQMLCGERHLVGKLKTAWYELPLQLALGPGGCHDWHCLGSGSLP